jgi:hypothetical protein
MERGVGEELNRIFSEDNLATAEKKIAAILDAYIYVLSRTLNKTQADMAAVIDREESLLFYHDLLRASQME